MVSVKIKTHVKEYDVGVRRVGYHQWIVKVKDIGMLIRSSQELGFIKISIAPGVRYGITCVAPRSGLSGLSDSSNRVRGLND